MSDKFVPLSGLNPLEDSAKLNSPGSFQDIFRDYNIRHLSQMHKVEGGLPDLNFIEMVVRSQFNVYQDIIANPNAAVFKEGLYEDLTLEDYQTVLKFDADMGEINIVAAIEINFPYGVPKSFDDLNDVQRQIFYEFGGAHVAYYLGKLDYIHKTLDKDESDKIDTYITSRVDEFIATLEEAGVPDINRVTATMALLTNDPSLQSIIFAAREDAAMRQIARYITETENPKRDIILVFGGAHDFSKFFTGGAHRFY